MVEKSVGVRSERNKIGIIRREAIDVVELEPGFGDLPKLVGEGDGRIAVGNLEGWPCETILGKQARWAIIGPIEIENAG